MSLSRKRSWEGDSKAMREEEEESEKAKPTSHHREEHQATTTISEESLSPLVPALRSCNRLRLEAVFHPKFENENQRERTVRERMKERVRGGGGYLEASLKHSGSLLLWSGGGRYYGKNSTDNRYTHAGEILLRQHFVRAFWTDSKGVSAASDLVEAHYRQCSDYVEKNRLTLSFEVVTTVLGDHGARPIRDFLILTAVADRATGTFLSTVELKELAQRFRLPHNDSWMFAEPASVEALFRFYDTGRETGLADAVVKALSEAADAHVASMYPHADFQGNILEGIVIRFVPFQRDESKPKALERISRLAAASRSLFDQVPPSLPDCFELVKMVPVDSSIPTILTTNLRELYRDTKAAFTAHGEKKFTESLRRIVSESTEHRRTVVRFAKQMYDFPAMTKILADESRDNETQRIAGVIQRLSGISDRVSYTMLAELDDKARFLCIVHVLFDQTFQKFQKQMQPGDMPLYRGFVVELSRDKESTSGDGFSINDLERKSTNETTDAVMAHDEVKVAETLMLKMKFLPYMVRTFGCRNGLRVLRQGGPPAFSKYVTGLLSKWGISQSAQQTWLPFFRAWAVYAKLCLDGKPPTEEAKALPTLDESNYLGHLELFQELYERGDIMIDNEVSKDCLLRGLLVVVALERETADRVAACIAEQLGGARRIHGVDQIAADVMVMSCESGKGHVCSAVVDDGPSGVRKLCKNYADFISIAIFQCSEDDIARSLLPQQNKTSGFLKGWRKTRCAKIYELEGGSMDGDAMETDDNLSFETSDTFREMLAELKRNSVVDERPGLLVFFPGIPGCGKSAYSGVDEKELQEVLDGKEDTPSRKLIVQVGDKTNEKYWPLVRRMRLKDRSSVYIADKNVPRTSWGMVGDICAATKALAVPVIPDRRALRTTRIEGLRKPDGTLVSDRVHVYPFSLPYLAVCVARIMDRPAGSHAGKLDSSTARACMVVVKFFSLYRNLSADEFVDDLTAKFSEAGALVSSDPIEVPFFRENGDEKLPDDLEGILEEALRCQYGFDYENNDAGKANDPYIDDLEKRLRDCIQRSRESILGLAAEESESHRAFLSALIDRVAEADSMTSYEGEPHPLIKIASIDVDPKDVREVLGALRPDERVAPFFDTIAVADEMNDGLSEDGEEEFPGASRLVAKTHVTMAHARHMSQSEFRNVFGPLCGEKIEVVATGLIWSRKIAALAVTVANETSQGDTVPPSLNPFPHITIWVQKGASAVEANDLPDLVNSGDAQRVDFITPFPLQGAVSLWNV